MSPSDDPTDNFNNGVCSQITVAAVNAKSAHLSMAAVTTATGGGSADNAAVTSCLLGEVFPSSYENVDAAASPMSAAFYERCTFLLHRYSRAFSSPGGVLRNSSLLLAWHDRSAQSDMWLGEEEMVIKRFISDYGKYNKKFGGGGKGKSAVSSPSRKKSTANGSVVSDTVPAPPALDRPVLSQSMTALLQALPLEVRSIHCLSFVFLCCQIMTRPSLCCNSRRSLHPNPHSR
jgi:hypothetical protein